MKRIVVAPLALALACGPSGEDAPARDAGSDGTEGETVSRVAEQRLEGFRPLLTTVGGQYTLDGWTHFGPGYFELDPETGVLTSHGGMGLLFYSETEFGDFILDLEYRCDSYEANSGVFVRVPGKPTSDDYIYHSFEIQIDDSGEGIHQTGAAYDAEPPTRLASHPPGEWNHLRITFLGDHLEVELNGETVLDWDAEPRGKVEDFAHRGYIGLQNHDDRTAVSFRNVYAKEIVG